MVAGIVSIILAISMHLQDVGVFQKDPNFEEFEPKGRIRLIVKILFFTGGVVQIIFAF